MRILIFILTIFISEIKAQNIPYTFQAHAGILAGNQVKPSFTVQIFNGIRIDKWNTEAGITSGIDIYDQITILPLSAGFKWIPFKNGSLIPFIGLNAGYGFEWLKRKVNSRRYEGGTMFNQSFGIRLRNKWKAKMDFGIGFKQQRASIYSPFYDERGRLRNAIEEKYKFSRLSITYGLSF